MGFACFLAVVPGLAATGGEPPANPVDRLNASQMQEAFRLLQRHFVQPEKLSDEELNRAALHGLFARLQQGAALLDRSSDSNGNQDAAVTPLTSELLTPKVAYLRPGNFSPEELPQMDAALGELAKSTAETLLLDLRSPAPDGDFRMAQQILSRFLPEGEALFEIHRPGGTIPQRMTAEGTPLWTKSVLLLVDSETTNVAEAVAVVLKSKLKSFVIGSKTRGLAVQFKEFALGNDLALRLADAEIRATSGTDLFGSGLMPDVPAPFDPQEKCRIFTAAAKEGMQPFVLEAERPRMNEAALVAGSNPELTNQIAKSAGQKTAWDQPLPRERVVQQALDFLETNQFLKELDAPEIRRAKRK